MIGAMTPGEVAAKWRGISASERAAPARIAADLGSAAFALPGTVLERRIRCGKSGCR
jgi:hypothetical protein